MNYLNYAKLAIFLILLSFQSFAQDLELDWSARLEYSNQKDGFFSHFIETNDQYVYGLNTNLALRPSKADDKIKIIAYDKITMKQRASVALRGYKENEAKKDIYKPLDYLKTLVFQDKVYVFWIKSTNQKKSGKEELYVETFSSELKRIDKLKKIYTHNLSDEINTSRFAKSSVVVLGNKEAGSEIIIGSELPQKGDNVEFKFLILNSELETSEESTIELPITLKSTSYGLTSSYEYGKDGNIYVSSTIGLTREERKKAKKAEDLSYCVLSIINPETTDVKTFELKDDNKKINDFSYVITEKEIKIYGFFGDLEKDSKGQSIHGIFYTAINSSTLEDDGLNYTYFDKKTIDKLFAADKEDKKKTQALSKKKRAAAAKNDDESLDTRYKIESMHVIDDKNIVLMCSKMRNYSVTTCTTSPQGGTTCTTNYYCEKRNVTAIRVSDEGEIIWASNIDRSKTYSGWDIYDLKTAFKDNTFYCIYGSSYQIDATVKKGKTRKRYAELRDNFEYATFDYETGKFKKNTFNVNKKNTEKKDMKYVDPLRMQVFDNTFYVNYMVTRQKIGWCVANVICFPTLYYTMLSGDTKKATGNLGVIKILD
ncbi:MAG: hypothetical protein RI922_1383 [Bacteroidota bacterium]|jgi:hypothetical protein